MGIPQTNSIIHTDTTIKLWQNKAWKEISTILSKSRPNSEFNPESDPLAEHLWAKLLLLEVPHTFEEYAENVMAMLHKEAENLERAKLSVRSLRYSKTFS
ncbi:hypothetical protein [Pseudoalteromonas sp.]|uniref:hypothetical protein n=1 Tax=Pseudoalteromonas sp. TaxID=53249 RepID=UPI00272BA97A|nr:hypothetical protein [Pseudoalteromonas sp.]